MSNDKNTKAGSRIRVATAIAELLNAPRPLPIINLPTSTWRQAARFARQIDRAVTRGWWRAATQCQDELHGVLMRNRSEIDGAIRNLSLATQNRPGISATEIVNDLVAAEREFEVATCTPSECQVTVVTDPISLDGQYLGPFEVRLKYVDSRNCFANDPEEPFRYEVVALEPNRPGADDNVTHPHVSDDRLCEGDAGLAIRRALAEGRLLDFFLLVRQVLETYNPESAYVRLDEWEGAISCHDCGLTTCEDSRSFCERCEVDLCCDCTYGCNSCGEINCDACSKTCTGCSDVFCEACLGACERCEESFCKECLDDELCLNCHDAESDPQESDP